MNLRWVAFGSVLVGVLATGVAVGGQAEAAAGPPTVTGVSPAAGPTKGGNAVTIVGTGLSAVDKVSFGSRTSTRITHVSSTHIRVTAPGHGPGRVNVWVSSSAGRSPEAARHVYTFVIGGPRWTWSPWCRKFGSVTKRKGG